MELRSKGTDLFAWSRFGEESNIGYIFFRAEKGADLFKLELKSILNKSVPFCSFCSQRPVRTLIQDESGRYWLQGQGGGKLPLQVLTILSHCRMGLSR